MQKYLEKVEAYILYAVVFLLPIAFLAAFANAFETVKLTVLVYGLGLVLLVKAVRIVTTGKFEVSSSNFDLPVLLLTLAFLVSAILRTPNKMEAFFLPGTATAVVGGALLYYLLNQLSKKEKDNAKMLLFGSAAIFSVMVLLSAVNLFSKIPQLPAFMKQVSFSPTGGLLPAALFLAVLIPLGVSLFISEKTVSRKSVVGVSLALVVFALVVSVFNMLPGKTASPRFPSAQVSWSVAVDSLKSSPIFGVGPGNYLTAFSRYRPIEYNSTDIWAIKFATSHDFYLTLFTETGLFGVAGLILLIIAIFRFTKTKAKESSLASWVFSENASLVSLCLLVILMALFPATTLILALLFILLSFVSESKKSILNLSAQAPDAEMLATQRFTSKLPALLVIAPVVAVIAFVWIRGFTILRADARYKRALDAIVANDTQAYDFLQQAINLNPYVDRYHISYAQVNLALANSIAQTPADQITDQDRTNISQLVQQAIREGKSAVALNPLRAANWEILGRIYQALIPFAQGADTFAAQSLGQAVALDPINPNLRLALGGVYYGQKDYQTAIRVFELAAVTKNDLPNVHYNLAFALRENGNIDQAITEMTTVLSLVDRNSNDYQTAKSALDDLQKKQTATQAPTGEQLNPPQPAEQPIIEPPIELPSESQPPEAPISPSPTPTPEEGAGEVTPTPSVTP